GVMSFLWFKNVLQTHIVSLNNPRFAAYAPAPFRSSGTVGVLLQTTIWIVAKPISCIPKMLASIANMVYNNLQTFR
ncbi:MAG: hypothetical protein OXC79_02975, partial [Candidatus Poribacteria bacterium]|nr:hypothetical protein [Candidatus Poribacteria bacterium]